MTTVKIKGMKCGHCEAAVTKALSNIAGISDVQVDLANNEASYNKTTSVATNIIKEAIEKIGFEVED